MRKIIPIIIILIVIGGGAFYGGMKYQQSTRQNFAKQNLGEQEQRQQLLQGRTERAGSGFLSGEIIAKDEQSLTLRMQDGGSKIVFFSNSTQISKTAEGSVDDIDIGKQIIISGDQNPDGSVTAKTIQLSPRYPTPNKPR